MESYYDDYSYTDCYDGVYDSYDDQSMLNMNSLTSPNRFQPCKVSNIFMNLQSILDDMGELTGVSRDECLYAMVSTNWDDEKARLELLDDYKKCCKVYKTDKWSQFEGVPGSKTLLEKYTDYLSTITTNQLFDSNSNDLKKTSTCVVCFDEHPLVSAPCGHAYCTECWVNHVLTQHEEELGIRYSCMDPSCDNGLPLVFLSTLDRIVEELRLQGKTIGFQGANSCLMHRIHTKITKEYIRSSAQVRECNTMNCDTLYLKFDGYSPPNMSGEYSDLHELCILHGKRITNNTPNSENTNNMNNNVFDELLQENTNVHNTLPECLTPHFANNAFFHSPVMKKTLSTPLGSSTLPVLSTLVVCTCGTNICLECNEKNDHRPASCEDILRVNEEQQRTEHQNFEWMAAHTRRCKQCKIRIEKNEGCNHMTCVRCKYQFCWVCGEDWSEHVEKFRGIMAYKCMKYTTKSDVSANPQTGMEKTLQLSSKVKQYTYEVAALESQQASVDSRQDTWERLYGTSFNNVATNAQIQLNMNKQSDCGLEQARVCLIWCYNTLKYAHMKLFAMDFTAPGYEQCSYAVKDFETIVAELARQFFLPLQKDYLPLKKATITSSDACTKLIKAYS